MNLVMKISTGIATTVFAGGLVYGGIYRTQAKNAQDLQRELGGNGVRESLSVQQSLSDGRQDRAGAGSEETSGRNAGREDDNSREGGPGRAADIESGTEAQRLDQSRADVHPEEIVSIQSVVQSITPEQILFQRDDGDTIVVEGRALSFATEMGLSLTEGDHMILEGFYENGDFEVSSLENLTTGQHIILREPGGRPLWAGGAGRQGVN